MSTVLILACVWVLAASALAFFPIRYQIAPGLVLLAAAPVLLVFIALAHGVVLTAIGLFALVSMFRRPLIYFYRRARGLPAVRPRDGEEANR